MVKDATRAAFPTAACIPEVADLFAPLGVDVDYGPVTTLEAAAKPGETAPDNQRASGVTRNSTRTPLLESGAGRTLEDPIR